MLVIIMSVAVIGFSIYLIAFLLLNINAALLADEKGRQAPVKFEIERFEKLGLLK